MIVYTPKDIYFEYVETKAIEKLFNDFPRTSNIPQLNHKRINPELIKPDTFQNPIKEVIPSNEVKVAEMADFGEINNKMQVDNLTSETSQIINNKTEDMPVFSMSREEAINLLSNLERVKEYIKSSFLD